MTAYKVIDGIKNGVFLNLLCQVILMFLVPPKRLILVYDLPLRLLAFGLPLVVLWLCQLGMKKAAQAKGRQLENAQKKYRILWAVIVLLPLLACSGWYLEATRGIWEQLLYFSAVVMHPGVQ